MFLLLFFCGVFVCGMLFAGATTFILLRNERFCKFARRCVFKFRHRNRPSCAKLPPAAEDAWYTQKAPLLWAYAGGGHLHQYGNSIEAIDESIRRGFKIIEIDVSLTSDGTPVVTHWFRPDNQVVFDRTPTLAEFKGNLVNGKYHTMSLKELFVKYDDSNIFFSIDPAHLVALHQDFDLVRYIMENASVDFQKRVIYQVYTLMELERIKRLAPPFASLHYVLEFLNNKNGDYWKVPYMIPFFVDGGVRSVSLRDRPVTQAVKDAIAAFNESGISVSVTGVDYMDRARRLMAIGVRCFNTRLLEPGMFNK